MSSLNHSTTSIQYKKSPQLRPHNGLPKLPKLTKVLSDKNDRRLVSRFTLPAGFPRCVGIVLSTQYTHTGTKP